LREIDTPPHQKCGRGDGLRSGGLLSGSGKPVAAGTRAQHPDQPAGRICVRHLHLPRSVRTWL